jgi:DNA-binding transcriptional MerR regulator
MEIEMKVSEVANSLNTTAETVRHYTRIGYLKPAVNKFNGYKNYCTKEQRRLSFILSARQLGFTVKDIGKILSVSDKGNTPCPIVREIIELRIKESNTLFEKTLALKTRMEAAMNKWKKEPDKTPTGSMICHLIERFDE